jgi:hypothetical protein
MGAVDDFVARIEETCGEEKDYVVTFKYEKGSEAVQRILKKAKMKKSISRIIFELTFENVSFRLYGTGKAIFRNLKDKGELQKILAGLLL